jgi:FdhD protein
VPQEFPVGEWNRGELTTRRDWLSIEEPLAIQVEAKPFATLMRTPGRDEDLVRGFLFSEGMISAATDIETLQLQQGEARLWRVPAARHNVGWARAVQVSSSCGVCGRAVIDELIERIPPLAPSDPGPARICELAQTLPRRQTEFARTGGVHAAALFDAAGQVLDLAEDVGRHNALDKIAGAALDRQAIPLAESILIMTSRASFDIVQKAALAGIPTVAAMGAASSLAIELANSLGLRLYWFVRDSRAVTTA